MPEVYDRMDICANCRNRPIDDALKDGRVKVLLCTDAASEGLNLQAAAALINGLLPVTIWARSGPNSRA